MTACWKWKWVYVIAIDLLLAHSIFIVLFSITHCTYIISRIVATFLQFTAYREKCAALFSLWWKKLNLAEKFCCTLLKNIRQKYGLNKYFHMCSLRIFITPSGIWMQERQRTYEITLRLFRVFNVPVENQKILNISIDTAWKSKFGNTKKKQHV